MPHVPLIEPLIRGPIPSGSNVLVEFDPASRWLDTSLAMAAGWLKNGGRISYLAEGQPPDYVRTRLKALNVDVDGLEKRDQFWLTDLYTASIIGQKSKEKFHVDSLKVGDMAIWMGKEVLHEPRAPDFLVIADNISVLDRFNEEKNWIELILSRVYPMGKNRLLTQISGILGGAHSQWAYKQLEAASDCIIDFRLDETGPEARDVIRIRSMRNTIFDRKWHALRTLPNGDLELEN